MNIFLKSIVAGIILFPFSVFAQTEKVAPKLPVDEKSGLISFNKVVEVNGISAGSLYQRAFNWANVYYKNPTDVIREKDSVGGILVCKARFKVMNPADKKGLATDAGNVMYTLKVQFKEGRYRYELTEINWKQQSYYACERWMDKTATSYKPEYDYYLQQVETNAREILKALEKGLSTMPTTKNDDW